MVDRKASDIGSESWLSEREAELFIKYYLEGKGKTEAASEMGIEPGTASSMLQRIRDKKSKSEKTLEIFDEVESSE